MASLAETLIGGVQDTTKQMGGDVESAVKIAQGVQKMKTDRETLEQNKTTIGLKKTDQFYKIMDKRAKASTPAERKFFEGLAGPAYQSAYPEGNPQNFDYMLSSDELTRSRIVAHQGRRLTEIGTQKEYLGSLYGAYGGDPIKFKEAADAEILEYNKTKRAEIVAGDKRGIERRKNETTFRKEKGRLLTRAQNLGSKFAIETNKLQDAQNQLKRALKKGNVAAYNQAIVTVISINQDRISDQDFNNFSKEHGIGKIIPFVDKALGGIPTKTAHNLQGVLSDLQKARRNAGPKIQQSLGAQIKNLSQFADAPESLDELGKAFNLGQFNPPGKKKRKKAPDPKRDALRNKLQSEVAQRRAKNESDEDIIKNLKSRNASDALIDKVMKAKEAK